MPAPSSLPRLRACAVATFATSVLLAAALVAGADYDYQLEEWSAEWTEFQDDFDGSQLSDGANGTPFHWFRASGNVVQTGGVVQLGSPDEAPVITGPIITSETSLRATYRLAFPTAGHVYGLKVGNGLLGIDADELSLYIWSDTLSANSPLFIYLVDENNPIVAVQDYLISANPAVDLSGVDAIEIGLDLELDPSSNVLVPVAKFRLCSESPCASDGSPGWTTLNDGPSAFSGDLDSSQAHVAGPFAFVFDGNTPNYLFEVEQWRQTATASDDFEDDVFAARVPQTSVCPVGGEGAIVEAGGTVTLSGPQDGCLQPGDGTTFGFTGANPGGAMIDAKFEFEVPGHCESYGITTGQNILLGADFAALAVERSPDPLAANPEGTDQLTVRLHTEPEPGKPYVIAASHTISESPGDDTSLDDYLSIELRLDAIATSDGSATMPDASFRLCTASGCSGDFTSLTPFTGTGTSNDTWCRGLAANLVSGPGASGGAIESDEVMLVVAGASLLPEPAAALSQGIVLLTLGAIARRRSSRRG